MAKSTIPNAPTGPGDENVLRQLLRLAGGSLPADFLRLQGVNATELVAQGLLQRHNSRWSNSYVAGPLLRPTHLKH